MYLKLRVGAVMRERKMTVQELAKAADIAQNTARALSRGVNERVDFAVLNKVAKALGVRPLELLEEVETEPGKRVPTRKAA